MLNTSDTISFTSAIMVVSYLITGQIYGVGRASETNL